MKKNSLLQRTAGYYSHIKQIAIVRYAEYNFTLLKRYLRFWQSTAKICWERDIFTLAQALSYVTVLSLVPIFVIFFFILSNLTKDQEQFAFVINFVSQYFLPEYTNNLVSLLNNLSTQALNLGLIGFPALIAAGVFMYIKVDNSINTLWFSIEHRGIFQSLRAFVNSALIGPILIVALLSIPTYLRVINFNVFSSDQDSQFLDFVRTFGPFLTTFVLFALLYYFVPTEKVRLKSAIVGSFWISVLVRLVNYGLEIYFRNFASYDRLYASLSTLPVMMFWLYTMWLLILFGSVLVYVHQTFSHRKFVLTETSVGGDSNLQLAIKTLLVITHSYLNRKTAPDILSLCYTLNADKQSLQSIIRNLLRRKIICQIDDRKAKTTVENKYQLICSPDQIKLNELLRIYLIKNDSPHIPLELRGIFNDLDLNPILSNPNGTLLELYNHTSKHHDYDLEQGLALDYNLNLKNIELQAHIGVTAKERKNLQPVVIELELKIDAPLAAKTGDIADTLDYSLLRKKLEEKFSASSYNLLEEMAADILDFVHKDERVNSAKVSLNKPNALSGEASASIVASTAK